MGLGRGQKYSNPGRGFAHNYKIMSRSQSCSTIKLGRDVQNESCNQTAVTSVLYRMNIPASQCIFHAPGVVLTTALQTTDVLQTWHTHICFLSEQKTAHDETYAETTWS